MFKQYSKYANISAPSKIVKNKKGFIHPTMVLVMKN